MTRVDFLKLIPAAILALFWPEAKVEAGTMKVVPHDPAMGDLWHYNIKDGVWLGPNPTQIRATSATFTQPVKFTHVRAYLDKSRDRIVVEDEWPEDAE